MPIFNAFLAGAQAQQAQENFDKLTQLGMQGMAQNAPIQAALQAQQKREFEQQQLEEQRRQRLLEIEARNKAQAELEAFRQQGRRQEGALNREATAGLQQQRLRESARQGDLNRLQRDKQFKQSVKEFEITEKRFKGTQDFAKDKFKKEFLAEQKRHRAAMRNTKNSQAEIARHNVAMEEMAKSRLAITESKEEREVAFAEINQAMAEAKLNMVKAQIKGILKKNAINPSGDIFKRLIPALLNPLNNYTNDDGTLTQEGRNVINNFTAEFNKQSKEAPKRQRPPFDQSVIESEAGVEDRFNFNPGQRSFDLTEKQEVSLKTSKIAVEVSKLISAAPDSKYQDPSDEAMSQLTNRELRDARISPDARLREIKRRLNGMAVRQTSLKGREQGESAVGLAPAAELPEVTKFSDLPVIDVQEALKGYQPIRAFIGRDPSVKDMLKYNQVALLPNNELATQSPDAQAVLNRHKWEPYKVLADGTVIYRQTKNTDMVQGTGDFLLKLGTNILSTPLKFVEFTAEQFGALKKVSGDLLEAGAGDGITANRFNLFNTIAKQAKRIDKGISDFVVQGESDQLIDATNRWIAALTEETQNEGYEGLTGKIPFKNVESRGKAFISETLKNIIRSPLTGNSVVFAGAFAPVTLVAEAVTGEPTFGGPIIPKAVPLLGGMPLIDVAVMALMHTAVKGKKKGGISFEEALQKRGKLAGIVPELPRDFWKEQNLRDKINFLKEKFGKDFTKNLTLQDINRLIQDKEGLQILTQLAEAVGREGEIVVTKGIEAQRVKFKRQEITNKLTQKVTGKEIPKSKTAIDSQLELSKALIEHAESGSAIGEGVNKQVSKAKTTAFARDRGVQLGDKPIPKGVEPRAHEAARQQVANKMLQEGMYTEVAEMGFRDEAAAAFKRDVKRAVLQNDWGAAVKLASKFGKNSYDLVRSQIIKHLTKQGANPGASYQVVTKKLNRLKTKQKFKAAGIKLSETALKLVEKSENISETIASLSSVVTQNLLERGHIAEAWRLAKNFQTLVSSNLAKDGKIIGKTLTKEAAEFLVDYEAKTGFKLASALGKNVLMLNDKALRQRLLKSTNKSAIDIKTHIKSVKTETIDINNLLEKGDWGIVAKQIPHIKNSHVRKAAAKAVSQIMHVTSALFKGKIGWATSAAKRIKNLRVRSRVEAIIDDVKTIQKKGVTPEQLHNIAKKDPMRKAAVDTVRAIQDHNEHGAQMATQLAAAPERSTLETAPKYTSKRDILKKEMTEAIIDFGDIKKDLENARTNKERMELKEKLKKAKERKDQLHKQLEEDAAETEARDKTVAGIKGQRVSGILTGDSIFGFVTEMSKESPVSFRKKNRQIERDGYTVSKQPNFILKFVRDNKNRVDLYYNAKETKRPYMVVDKNSEVGRKYAIANRYKKADPFLFSREIKLVNTDKKMVKFDKMGTITVKNPEVAYSLFTDPLMKGHLYFNKEAGIQKKPTYVFTKDPIKAQSLIDAGFDKIITPRELEIPTFIAESLEAGEIPTGAINAAAKGGVVLQGSLLPIPYDFFIKTYGLASRVIRSIFTFDYKVAERATKETLKENVLQKPKNLSEALKTLFEYELPEVDTFIDVFEKKEMTSDFFTGFSSPSTVIPTIQSGAARATFIFERTINQLRTHVGAALQGVENLEKVVDKLEGKNVKLGINDRLAFEYLQELFAKITEGGREMKKISREDRFKKLEKINRNTSNNLAIRIDQALILALRRKYVEPMLKRLKSIVGDLSPKRQRYAKDYLDVLTDGMNVSKIEKGIRDFATRGFLWFNTNFPRMNMLQAVSHDFSSNFWASVEASRSYFRNRKTFIQRAKSAGVIRDFRHIVDLKTELGLGKELSNIKWTAEKVDKAGFFLAQKTEAFNRSFSFNVGLYDGISKGFEGKALVDHAVQWVQQNHYETGVLDRAPRFSRSRLGRAVNFFTQYNIKDTEFLMKKAFHHKAGLVTYIGLAYALSELQSTVGLSSSFLFTGLPFAGDIGETTGLNKKTALFASNEGLGWTPTVVELMSHVAKGEYAKAAISLLSVIPLARAITNTRRYWGIHQNALVMTEQNRRSTAGSLLRYLKRSHEVVFEDLKEPVPYQKLRWGEWALRMSGLRTELQDYENVIFDRIKHAQEMVDAASGKRLITRPDKSWNSRRREAIRQFKELSKEHDKKDKTWRRFRWVITLPWYAQLDVMGWLVELRKKQNGL